MVGPFSYTWLPGNQTTSVVNGLVPGTYTVSVYSASCGVTATGLCTFTSNAPPCISVSSTSITCANLGSATVVPTFGNAPYTYTWQPTNQTGSVVTGLSPGTYTLTVLNQTSNTTFTATTTFVPLVPLAGNLAYTASLMVYLLAQQVTAMLAVAAQCKIISGQTATPLTVPHHPIPVPSQPACGVQP